MTVFRRLPIRARLTAGFAIAMAALLAAIVVALHLMMGAVLLDELETGLRTRAVTIEEGLPARPNLAAPTRGLIETHEAFAQVVARDGRVLDASPGVTRSLLTPPALRSLAGPRYFDRRIPGAQDTVRFLAVPTKGGASSVVVVGASMSDRTDALHSLTVFFLIGGPIALAIASAVGWFVAGRALTPVERMRKQASQISASATERRLTVPEPDDELRRLAETLNDMLDRLDNALRAERRLLDNASHELRTPLAALKAELDVARRRPRSREELAGVVESASEETDRLARMADDLLLMSRAHAGKLPLRLEVISLAALLDGSTKRFAARAEARGVTLRAHACEQSIEVDEVRIGQAIDNVLDNAIRAATSAVTVTGAFDGDAACITVDDDGPGLPRGFERHEFEPFEPFERGEVSPGCADDGAGLGLAIVASIVEAHGGTIRLENIAPGARVTMTLPVGQPHPL